MKFHLCFSVVFCLFIYHHLNAQNENIIFLKNPSFEGIPAHGTVPEEWVSCGFPNESPPDVLDKTGEPFAVIQEPFHGTTYLGMVVRDNNTWESLGQQLHRPMKVGETYIIQMMLSTSKQYISFSRKSGNQNTEVNYSTPTILRIWGGRTTCAKDELLAISKPITHQEWENYQFELSPQEYDYHFLTLEVYYSGQYPLIGNLLVDDVSNIVLESSAKTLFPDLKKEHDNFTLPPEAKQMYTQKPSSPTAVSIIPPSQKASETARIAIESKEPEPAAGEDELESFEDLQWVVKENGQKISFKKGKLEKGFYKYYGRTYFQNVYLHNIISALKIMPEYRISIAVYGKSSGEVKKKTKHLQKGFDELGLSQRNYRFVEWPDVVRAQDWVWPANINDLLIGLEKI